eukprot:TRINITY_DN7895_c0_g1_i1.p1 TRINITY_DN7895_c0_g1~~TRINITY_DN7895_c0_g1_i1.p1  ORF type:complete len:473 (+),score=74.04 TRINITY_DN7895_c0_g1_i1:490-1908(+)
MDSQRPINNVDSWLRDLNLNAHQPPSGVAPLAEKSTVKDDDEETLQPWMIANFKKWMEDLQDSLLLIDTHKTKGALLRDSMPDATLAVPSPAGASPCLWTSVVAIELKASSKGFKKEHFEQAVRYTLQLLEFQTWRDDRAAIGVMCDHQHIAFFRIELVGTLQLSLKVTHWTSKIEWKHPDGYRLVRALCTSSAARQTISQTLNEFQNLSFLGYGATSTVYSSGNQVLKVYLPRADLAELIGKEESTLRKLSGTAGVPTVCQTIKPPAGQLALDKISATVHILVMKPVCELFSEILTGDRIVQLLAILAAAEDVGLVHTDVRPPNILIKDGQIYLADWGYARDKGIVDVKSLDLRFASPSILHQAMKGTEITISALDDCWSVFLCALSIYLARFGNSGELFIAPEDRNDRKSDVYAAYVRGFWRGALDRINRSLPQDLRRFLECLMANPNSIATLQSSFEAALRGLSQVTIW